MSQSNAKGAERVEEEFGDLHPNPRHGQRQARTGSYNARVTEGASFSRRSIIDDRHAKARTLQIARTGDTHYSYAYYHDVPIGHPVDPLDYDVYDKLSE